jgi:hypothetical protein
MFQILYKKKYYNKPFKCSDSAEFFVFHCNIYIFVEFCIGFFLLSLCRYNYIAYWL